MTTRQGVSSEPSAAFNARMVQVCSGSLVGFLLFLMVVHFGALAALLSLALVLFTAGFLVATHWLSDEMSPMDIPGGDAVSPDKGFSQP